MVNIVSLKEFDAIRQLIEEKSGIVLNEQNAHLLESRMDSILSTFMMSSVEELHYRLCVAKDHGLATHIIEAIATNETFWFRDKALWIMMEELFIPRFISQLQTGERKSIKIWSAACSYGQEPYSIAMSIVGYLQRHGLKDITIDDFEILATDISHSALNTAKCAQYDAISISRGLEDKYRHMHFRKEGNNWHLNDTIKERIDFKHFNLIDGPYGTDIFDMILCRNVLIYFSESNKKMIYEKLAQALTREGVLVIGSSELLGDEEHRFSREQYLDGIFYKKNNKRSG